jgi:hypothetical protein
MTAIQHLCRVSIVKGHRLDIKAEIECKGYIMKKVIETYHLLIGMDNPHQTLARLARSRIECIIEFLQVDNSCNVVIRKNGRSRLGAERRYVSSQSGKKKLAEKHGLFVAARDERRTG